MQGFNIRVNFLQSGIDIKVEGNSITSQDIQDFFSKIAAKTIEKTQTVTPPSVNADFVSMYDQIGKDVTQVVDKAIEDMDKSFEGFDDLFGDTIKVNPFDKDQIQKAQETVDLWGQKATSIMEEAEKVAKQKAEDWAARQPPNPDYDSANAQFVVISNDKTSYIIKNLVDLKQIPGFYDSEQYHQFKYTYASIELDRKTFMAKVFNNLKP